MMDLPFKWLDLSWIFNSLSLFCVLTIICYLEFYLGLIVWLLSEMACLYIGLEHFLHWFYWQCSLCFQWYFPTGILLSLVSSWDSTTVFNNSNYPGFNKFLALSLFAAGCGCPHHIGSLLCQTPGLVAPLLQHFPASESCPGSALTYFLCGSTASTPLLNCI